MDNKILDKILQKTGNKEILKQLNILSNTELQSLMLELYASRSKNIPFSKILDQYEKSRFTKPSEINARKFLEIESKLLSFIPKDYNLIELSPVVPFGSSSVLGPVHQNNVVTTIRNTEIISDPTNILALEAAVHRKKQDKIAKLTCHQRLVRAQSFDNPKFSAHFKVFAMCTAGKDKGHLSFEKETLKEHLDFYFQLIFKLIDKRSIKKVLLKIFDLNDSENQTIHEFLSNLIKEYPEVKLNIDSKSKYGEGYYSRLRFMINLTNNKDESFDIIDGGFTNWTAKLLNNNKERLLTSGIGTELLLRAFKIV